MIGIDEEDSPVEIIDEIENIISQEFPKTPIQMRKTHPNYQLWVDIYSNKNKFLFDIPMLLNNPDKLTS